MLWSSTSWSAGWAWTTASHTSACAITRPSYVRGDRPDIQMAALQTPTACMLITKGVELIEYVQYEAEQNEVPVILVEADTLSTMAFLDTALDGARFDHPAKLDRSAELLKKHVDLASIYSALGIAA